MALEFDFLRHEARARACSDVLFALVSLGVVIFAHTLPDIYQEHIRVPLIVFLIVFLGIPHGAVDHRVHHYLQAKSSHTNIGSSSSNPSNSNGNSNSRSNNKYYQNESTLMARDELNRNRKSRMMFYVYYLGIMGAYAIMWQLQPVASLLFFLLLSSYHFGQGELVYLFIEPQSKPPPSSTATMTFTSTSQTVASFLTSVVEATLKTALFFSRGAFIIGMAVCMQPHATLPIICDIVGFERSSSFCTGGSDMATSSDFVSLVQKQQWQKEQLPLQEQSRPAGDFTSFVFSVRIAQLCIAQHIAVLALVLLGSMAHQAAAPWLCQHHCPRQHEEQPRCPQQQQQKQSPQSGQRHRNASLGCISVEAHTHADESSRQQKGPLQCLLSDGLRPSNERTELISSSPDSASSSSPSLSSSFPPANCPLWLDSSIWGREVAKAALFWVLFTHLDAFSGFAVYFGLWHSRTHIISVTSYFVREIDQQGSVIERQRHHDDCVQPSSDSFSALPATSHSVFNLTHCSNILHHNSSYRWLTASQRLIRYQGIILIDSIFSFFQEALPFTLISVVGMAFLYATSTYYGFQIDTVKLWSAFCVHISVLTAAHAWVVDMMYSDAMHSQY